MNKPQPITPWEEPKDIVKVQSEQEMQEGLEEDE